MKGIELARGYYEEYGLPMLKKEFPALLPLLAVGLTGKGSENFGFDDEISRDHDFEPGFCIFIPGEDIVDRRTEFLLSRAYCKLPKEYLGVKRGYLSPVGGNRHGVLRTADYYLSAVGTADGRLSTEAWLHIPDYALAEAVNGEIWFDGYGEVTEIRRRLSEMPKDVMLKRLAGNLLLMAQSGQYNFGRCLLHGEAEASQLACNEFVNSAMKVLMLLNGRYLPFYKWSFRALRSCENTAPFADSLSLLLSGGTDVEASRQKSAVIEEISRLVAELLRERGLTKAEGTELEKHAYSVNDSIKDGNIRNLHILTCI